MQLQAEHISDMEHLNRLRERKVLRCAIYIRVSTAEQRVEGWSLQAQEAGLRKLAEAKGWKVVGVYADEGKTARKRLKDRKAIHRLMADVRAGLVDIIAFKELDRWFRNISDFYKIQDVLDAHGVEWFSQQQPSLEMRTKEGRLQTNVLLSVGQNETDAGSDRIKYTKKYLVSQKRWHAGARTLPKCYTTDENHRVVIDPAHEPYTRMLIEELQKTSSFQTAMLRANEAYPGSAMFYNNIVRMIRNTLMYGEYDGIPDFVEKPIMTKKDWELLQAKTTRSARYQPNQFYIFSRMVKCAECGTSMNGTASYKNIKDGSRRAYKYHSCPYAKIQGRCSNKIVIREDQIEAQLMEQVKASVEETIAKVEQVEQAKKNRPKKKNNREAIEKQLERLENVYIDSLTMTEEKYEQKKAAILAKLVEEEPEEKLPDMADLEKVKALFEGDIEETYETLTLEERREFWSNIIAEIQVFGKEIKGIKFLE
jgi:DNA invertase Pin-like site-specific DNA recombinase